MYFCLRSLTCSVLNVAINEWVRRLDARMKVMNECQNVDNFTANRFRLGSAAKWIRLDFIWIFSFIFRVDPTKVMNGKLIEVRLWADLWTGAATRNWLSQGYGKSEGKSFAVRTERGFRVWARDRPKIDSHSDFYDGDYSDGFCPFSLHWQMKHFCFHASHSIEWFRERESHDGANFAYIPS